jgi:hypothetical protein
MRCQTCGNDNPDSFTFCPICGNPIPRAAAIDKNAVKAPKEEIVKAVSRRSQTDRYLSPAWIFFLVLVIIVSTIIGIVAIFGAALDFVQANPGAAPDYRAILDQAKGGVEALVIGNAIYYVCLGYLVFMLVKRLNDHFTRDDDLRKGILDFVGSASSSANLKTYVASDIATMEEMDNQSLASEARRSPILWMTLIAAIPWVVNLAFVSAAYSDEYSGSFSSLTALNYLISFAVIVATLYMFHFLGKSMRSHDRRDMEFYTSARRALSKLGFEAGSPYSIRTLPERSFVLYLVLSIVTLGIFTFYWWYTLLLDPNDHFRTQWEFEDNVMSILQ